jgi:YbbR domain-containing protein
MEISNDPREDVEVVVTGSKQALDRINARDLVAYVDVSDRRPGERLVRLSPERVRLELPDGVRLESISPATAPLRLEPGVERELPAHVQLEGKLPEGYELRSVTVSPDKIRVRGPASHVAALENAPTESISLDGRRESANVSPIAIDISDQKVTALDSTVNARLEIGEQRIEKSFAGVRVQEQDKTNATRRAMTANVMLYGARSVIERLRIEDVQIILSASASEPATTASAPRLVLPSGIENSVELRFVKLNEVIST